MDFYNQYDLDNLKLITKPLIKNNIKGYGIIMIKNLSV
jgi:hypothetical protein